MQNLQNRQANNAALPGRPRHRRAGDLVSQMAALQREMNARNFAVLRIMGTGIHAKRHIGIAAENFAPGETGVDAIIAAYGDTMLANIDIAANPLLWNGRDEASTAETVDFDPFVVRLRDRVLPFSGIAFPVRLGGVGNGYAVFTTRYFDLTSEAIIHTHLQATAVLVELLQEEERRSQPAEALTEREVACLQMAGDGFTSEEVAEKLGLSVHTVNAYLGTATIKLDSVNRIQAIAKAIRLGYIN